MKLLNIFMASILALSLTATASFADSARGQKAFIKFLKEPCGMDGAKFALKHTQDEWKQKRRLKKFAQTMRWEV